MREILRSGAELPVRATDLFLRSVALSNPSLFKFIFIIPTQLRFISIPQLSKIIVAKATNNDKNLY